MSQLNSSLTKESTEQSSTLQRYYKLHSRVYDVTRWSFLFGRKRIVELAAKQITPKNILEIGCGTGTNLKQLAKRFPQAKITGVDLSNEMLDIAKRKLTVFGGRVNLHQQAYSSPIKEKSFDLIICSYSLSMFNPGWDVAIQAAKQDLADNGLIAVVDFHHSAWGGFRRWMGVNHVKMEGHLLPQLNDNFQSVLSKQALAYAGVWRYLLFLGK